VKVTVTVTFKQGVLEPQGQAVLHSLHSLGYGGVRDVRVGKLIELEVDGADPDKVREDVRAMCEELLASPVIENYAIDLEGAPAPG
jgi:phosphoribosylformylglycinamidine synthase PurS subunit